MGAYNNHKHTLIPSGQTEALVCECGSNEFLVAPVAKLLFNRLNPKEFMLDAGQKLSCWWCGRFAAPKPDGTGWTTIAPVAPARKVAVQ